MIIRMILLIAFIFPSHALGAALKVRAREHYEAMTLRTESDKQTYSGLSNTINVWWEEPFHYSIGFAGGPLIGRIFSQSPLPGFAGEISIRHFGIELKSFPAADATPVFLRAGIFDCTIRTRSDAGTPRGLSQLLGVGYEFNWSGVGIAPEFSWRWLQVSNRIFGSGPAPAIGVHFYQAI